MATTHDIASKEAMEPKGPSPRIRTLPSVFSEVPGLPGSSSLGRGSSYLGLLDKFESYGPACWPSSLI